MSTPAYLHLLETGELEKRAARLQQRLSACDLCPWQCKTDRLNGPGAVCRIGGLAQVSSFGAHFGEEGPLTGRHGSGTIFFSGCNLRCQYCQNHTISQAADGETLDAHDLASVMLALQAKGCHNINLVTPSHVVPQIVAALVIAARGGLRIPLVYNTGGYDAVSTLELLDGVIDIYMPDMKYSSAQTAQKYSKAARYPLVNRAAVKEMHRQVGDLALDSGGIAARGLLVRHLVLPKGLAGTDEIVRFLAQEISADTYLNLMDQYRPEFNVARYPGQFEQLRRRITATEYRAAVEMAQAAGLRRLDRRM